MHKKDLQIYSSQPRFHVLNPLPVVINNPTRQGRMSGCLKAVGTRTMKLAEVELHQVQPVEFTLSVQGIATAETGQLCKEVYDALMMAAEHAERQVWIVAAKERSLNNRNDSVQAIFFPN